MMTPEEGAVIEAALVAVTARSDRRDYRIDLLMEAAGALLAARAKPEWHPATFMHVLAGDRIRLGQDEATVLRCNLGIWHADTSDAWRPKAWTHTELRMELDVVPGFQQYPPGTACEILCTPLRLAVLRMGQAFPGSTVIGRPEGIDELPRIGRGMDPL